MKTSESLFLIFTLTVFGTSILKCELNSKTQNSTMSDPHSVKHEDLRSLNVTLKLKPNLTLEDEKRYYKDNLLDRITASNRTGKHFIRGGMCPEGYIKIGPYCTKE